ncbi:MAG: hypothetical protein ACOYNZ_00660 [Rhodoferax sp.]
MPIRIHRLLIVMAMLYLSCCAGSATTVAKRSPVAEPSPVAATHLGANLQPIRDWSFTPVYVDLMHQARKFGSPAAPWDEAAALGSDGWPVGDFGVVLLTGASKYSGNAGTYKVSFRGQALVKGVASSAQVLHQTFDAARNLSSAEVLLPANEEQLMLSFTHTGTGIKDLKVIRPGYDAASPPLFTRSFLSHIARFKTLRFMDWLRTNNNPVTSWAARATPEKTHYASSAGVPWEHIVALANQGQKDIWINLPIGVDDDYVLQLARLLKRTLNTDSKVYLEYSNEIWNGGFAQYNSNRALAIAEVQANPASPLIYDGKREPSLIAFRRIAKRLKEFSDIFRQIYGDKAMMSTIRPVLGFQVVQSMTARFGLDFIADMYGPPARFFHAIAGAPYFDLGDQQTVDGLSTDEVLTAMKKSIERRSIVSNLEADLALAAWYGLKFLAYEGGSATFGTGSLAAKKAANLDPRMLDLCVDYLERWYRQGGGMLMWFMAGAGDWNTRYGTWELTTDLALTDTPKIKCMDRVLGAPAPAAAGRHQVPGTFDALAYVGNPSPYSEKSRDRVRYLHPGASIEYLVQAPVSANYSLIIRSEAAQGGNTIDLAVNSTLVEPAFELAKTGWGHPADNRPITVELKQGFNTLRLTTRMESSGFIISSLSLR